MEESISSSRTTTAFHGANNHSYNDHHQPPPAATASSDLEDADDSGWTAYFLQLASDEEEEDAPASASASRKKQLRDVGSGCASASTVFKPNKDKDNKQAVKKVLKKTKEVLHLVSATRIIVEEEEDPLQDTASSPLLIGATKYKRTPAGS